MEYDVKVTGIEDIEKLTANISKLERVLESAKGSGKSLEEVRKIIVGLRGQESVFQALVRGVESVNPAIDKLEAAFRGVGSTISGVLKSELELTRATLRTEIMTLATMMGSPLAAKITGEVGGALEKGIQGATAVGKSAAAKARAEMTAAYEKLVGGEGLKSLNVDELGQVKLLKAAGATISKYHAEMLKNYETHNRQVRIVDEQFQKGELERLNRHISAKAAIQRQETETYKASIAAMNQQIAMRAAIQKQEQDAYQSHVLALNKHIQNRVALEKQNADRLKAVQDKQVADYKANIDKLNSFLSVRSQLQKQLQLPWDIGRKSVDSATANSAGVYSSLNTREVLGSTNQVKSYYKAMEDGLAKSSVNFKTFTKDAGDAHAAVRGLASGFNLLWLTWGNLGPLMAGAALSNTFMKAAKEGMQVAHTMEVIRTLGEASAGEVGSLRAELDKIGANGPHGPIAVADAMQTMVLAGMKVKDVMKEVSTVMDFSLAGTTTIQNAADVLVSVTTAFGTGAEGFSRTSDIIVRAAADSKASVESFGEAMKTASVVGEQYGAAQEDVAALISMLANLGIQGTSAGTAIRNMYADLSGRTGKTSKILRNFGLDLRDANGNMLPLVDTVEKLSKTLHKLDPKQAKDLMQALLSERGGKAFVAALAEYNQLIVTSEGTTNKLAERIKTLENASGDAGIAAARMSETTLSAWKRAGSALETSLLQVYDRMEPQLYRMANAMQSLFNDPSFIAGLSAIGGGLATIGEGLTNNIGLITTVAAAWGTWKLASIAMTTVLPVVATGLRSVQAVTLSSAASTATLIGLNNTYTAGLAAKAAAAQRAAAAEAAANTVAGTSISLFGRLGRLIPGIGTALTVAAVAWDVYGASKNRANGATAFALEQGENLIKNIEDRTRALNIETENLNKGIESGQAAALAQLENDREKNLAGVKQDMAAQQKVYDDALRKQIEAQRKLDAVKNESSPLRNPLQNVLIRATADADDAYRKLEATRQAVDKFNTKYDGVVGDFKAASARSDRAKAEALAKQTAESQKALKDLYANLGIKAGDMEFDPANPYGGSGNKFTRGPSQAQLYFDEQFELFKRNAEAEKTIVQALYDTGKIAATEYYDWLADKSQQSYEAERKALAMKAAALASDPKSSKEFKKAETDLAALDMKRTAEILRMEQERKKGVEDLQTPAQKLEASGREYLSNLRESSKELANIKYAGQEARLATARDKIHSDFAKDRLAVEKRFIEDSAGLTEEGIEKRAAQRDKELASIAAFENRALEIVKANENLKNAERSDGWNGLRRAFQAYADETVDVASRVERTATSIFSNFESQVANAMLTGKLSVRDFVTFALSELAKLAVRQAAGGLWGMAAGAASSFIGGMFGAPVSGASSVANSPLLAPSAGYSYGFAKGGAFNSPSLSSYSNSVHSTPKMFAFAQGGVFGEAGPEAIMPLTRGADGNLGVRSFGGGGVQITVQTTVVVQDGAARTTTKATSSEGGADAAMTALGNEVSAMIDQKLADATRQGGIIWKRTHGYA